MATSSSQPGHAPADAGGGRRFTPGPRRGDLRRAALLDALEALLADRPLSAIGVADIANAAGVSRSAFYFYFPNAAAAVAACMSDFYVEMEDVGSDWLAGGDRPPLERLTAGLTAASALWRSRAGLLTAMLDAVGTDSEVREIWDRWVQGFVDLTAARIRADAEAGLTLGDIDPDALAIVLIGAAAYAMEREVRAISAGDAPPEGLTAALIQLWYRTIYQDGPTRS